MMRVFDTTRHKNWGQKVNFVDENNVFVGYDLDSACCEHAGWFIADTIIPYSYQSDQDGINVPDIEGYHFDIGFFESVESEDLDDGGMVAFRLMGHDKPDLFLHLFNAHNGYYSHGFEVKVGEEVVKQDYL